MFRENILHLLHKDAEYISGGLTWVLSFISLNIHLSSYSGTILIKFLSGMISLLFTGVAVILTHFLKIYLEKRHSNKKDE